MNQDCPQSDRNINFPPRPDFGPLPDTHARQEMFGRFDFVRQPQKGSPEAIQILGDWVARNIRSVSVPQLAGRLTFGGLLAGGSIRFHQRGAAQLAALWAAWESAGLLDRVIFWGGSFSPRYVRGETASLSAHAFGAAFDINIADNPLGHEPARLGHRGCVRELVALANLHGFYWGGHFEGRVDGMHFEIARWWTPEHSKPLT